MIIANVSPAEQHVHESFSTLDFAARAKTIRNLAKINQATQGGADLLQRDNARLRLCAPSQSVQQLMLPLPCWLLSAGSPCVTNCHG